MIRIPKAHLTHKGLTNLSKRAITIFRNYGISTKQMESNLIHYLNVLKPYAVTPTFPITANLLNRNRNFLKKLNNLKVDFAIHGNRHVDHTKLSEDELIEHIHRAINSFKKNKIPFGGFRFPYLKSSPLCLKTLSLHDVKWDSSESVYWDVLPAKKFSKRKMKNFHSMLDQYAYHQACESVSLPRFTNGILEIPVSLPDDDLLHRLGIHQERLIKEIWENILYQTHARGELFCLQLHPERIKDFDASLISIVEKAQSLMPPIWVTSLNDIYLWWREKLAYKVDIMQVAETAFVAEVTCSSRASVIIKSINGESKKIPGENLRLNNCIKITSLKRPIVGVSKRSSKKLKQFLKNEGFVFEFTDNCKNYDVYLDFPNFTEKDEREIIEAIFRDSQNLIRFARWPNPYQSALSLSGDIDALSTFDFMGRLLH